MATSSRASDSLIRDVLQVLLAQDEGEKEVLLSRVHHELGRKRLERHDIRDAKQLERWLRCRPKVSGIHV